MKITRIVKRLGKVFQSGGNQYSPLHIHAEVEATLDENDTVEAVDKALFDRATEMIGNDLKRIKELKNTKEAQSGS